MKIKSIIFFLIAVCSACAQNSENSDAKKRLRLNTEFIREMHSLAVIAFAYRSTPFSQGGGEGAYEGFTIPEEFNSTEVGKYSLHHLTKNEIAITIQRHQEKNRYVFTIDSLGKSSTTFIDWYYTLRHVAALAFQYRNRSRSMGGGEGSYVGFTIPADFDAAEYGEYKVYDVQPEELVLTLKLKGEQNSYIYIFDSFGNQKPPEYKARGNVDAFVENNNSMVQDMRRIADAALNYHRNIKTAYKSEKTFEGFVIPRYLFQTKNGKR